MWVYPPHISANSPFLPANRLGDIVHGQVWIDNSYFVHADNGANSESFVAEPSRLDQSHASAYCLPFGSGPVWRILPSCMQNQFACRYY